MELPKLSIITVCLNEKKVETTCNSIATQTWRNFEWIVIDGGSTDETLEILHKYKEHMKVFVSEEDTGIYNAMNKGLTRANGEYVIFMNGGDYFLDPYVLQRAFGSNEWNEDIIYGDALFLKEDGTTMLREFDNFKKIQSDFFTYNCFAHQATFIRRNLFLQYGGYNEKYRIVSDWEKWIDFIVIHHATSCHHPMIVAVHNYNGVSSRYTKEHVAEREEVLHKYYPEIFVQANELPLQMAENNYEAPQISQQSVYINDSKIKLFGFISFLKIKCNVSRTKLKIYLFNIIPLLKISRYR